MKSKAIVKRSQSDTNKEPKRAVKKPKSSNASEDKPVCNYQDLLARYAEELTQEQLYALNMAIEEHEGGRGHNMLICGAAGTGKTTLLRALVAVLAEMGFNVALTAMTGLAACNIGAGATTLHSWMGLGKCEASPEEEIARLRRYNSREVLKRWKTTDYLIIDEISMLSAETLIKLEQIARAIRGIGDFGGLRIILSGDPFQLPPVWKQDSTAWCPSELKEKFFFETDVFKQKIQKKICLSTIFRQQADQLYVSVLNSVRSGEIHTSEYYQSILKSRVGAELACPYGIKPTVLLPTRKEVNDINTNELKNLPGEVVTYRMRTAFSEDMDTVRGQILINKMKAACNVEEVVELKVGATVVLMVNADKSSGLVNGLQGKVVRFENRHHDNFGMIKIPVVQFVNRDTTLAINIWTWEKPERRPKGRKGFYGGVLEQIPLQLAFALTVHKAQGMTLRYIITSLGKTMFADGQAYTALSRVTQISGLSLTQFSPEAIKINPKVIEFYKLYAGVKASSKPDDASAFASDLNNVNHSRDTTPDINIEEILDGKDYYTILNLDHSFTEEQLKKSFKDLTARWNPEFQPVNRQQLALVNHQAIVNAFNTLRDPKKRHEYDSNM